MESILKVVRVRNYTDEQSHGAETIKIECCNVLLDWIIFDGPVIKRGAIGQEKSDYNVSDLIEVTAGMGSHTGIGNIPKLLLARVDLPI